MEFHDASNIFPMDETTIGDLAKDIRANGQQVPIEIMGGKILDGRRRWQACERAGVKPITKNVSPDDPVAYVLSLNLHRRHLTPSQLAMVGARARKIYDEQAKERQKLSQGRGVKGPENLPDLKSDARDAVGKAVGVSGKTIDHATKVLTLADPEVVRAVDEGRMSVSAAAILSLDPPDVQRAEANSPRRRRDYLSVTKNGLQDKDEPKRKRETDKPGVGVIRANEAINALSRIPKNDPLRKRGFQIVTDWIRKNK